MTRYVVLHHVGHGRPHYDLMIEATPGGALLTWRVDRWPPVPMVTPQRIADHRREFLTYEGPVSGGRGRVLRVEAGTVTREKGGLTLTSDAGRVLRWDGF